MTHNWTYKKLGEIATSDLGKTLNHSTDKGNLYPYLCAINVLWDRIDLTTIKQTKFELSELERYSVQKGDLLICEGGDTGRAAIWESDEPMLYQNALHRVRFNSDMNARFVLYFLRHLKNIGDIDLKYSKGVTIKHLVKSSLMSIPIPIPSLSEQESIVAELDAINHLIDLHEQQLCEYDRLAQSLFYTTFGDPISNPKGWEVKKLGEICVNITDGDHMPPPKTENGIPFITISNVDKEQNRISFENTFFVSSEYYESIKEEKRAQIGDVLYTVTGSYGIPIVVDFNRRFCFQRHIGLIRPVKEQLLPRYLACWLKSEDGMRQADMKATGIAQKTVSLASLRGFNIPLPPLSLQQTFAAQIEAIEQQKALIRRSLDETRTLLAARMQYYFE